MLIPSTFSSSCITKKLVNSVYLALFLALKHKQISYPYIESWKVDYIKAWYIEAYEFIYSFQLRFNLEGHITDVE